MWASSPQDSPNVVVPVAGSAQIQTNGVCAWFSGRLVLESVSLNMERSRVTALIGPSGCGKSTFLRILNRMHELVPGAQLAGKVRARRARTSTAAGHRATEARKHIGMVFQKPNPFPAMTIEENVAFGVEVFPDQDQRSRQSETSSRRC